MKRSIRHQLTLWFAGMLALILCLFGWVLYTNVAANLSRDVDTILASQADGVADAIYAFWEADAARTPQADMAAQPLPDLISRWADETSELDTVRPVRLLDREGALLDASPSFEHLVLPLMPAAVATALQGRTVYETFSPPEQRVRVVTRPIIESHHVLYLVQVAMPLRQMDAWLCRLRLWLWWLIPSVLLVTSAIGWGLATVALRPIDRMAAQAKRISAEQLHERIDVPRTGDELERLATTFNEMLGRLEQAFRRLRQFSAAASHELRTPLTIMKGELEVALRKPRDAAEYQRVLRAHLAALNDMANTIEELLALSRSDAGEGVIEWQAVDLGALSRQACDQWQPLASSRQIEVQAVVPEAVWVRGERRLLERLVANLLDNALKHTPPHGRVIVDTVRHGAEAHLTVRDSGPGIRPELLPNLFDQFFSRKSPNDPQPSTGLGLGLCRWIAEAHQGRIDVVQSAEPGAAFAVCLPLAPPAT